MWEWDWTEPDAKKARSCDAGGGEAGGDEKEVVVYEWRWTEAVSPEILALVFRGRLAADEVARGAALVCRRRTSGVAGKARTFPAQAAAPHAQCHRASRAETSLTIN